MISTIYPSDFGVVELRWAGPRQDAKVGHFTFCTEAEFNQWLEGNYVSGLIVSCVYVDEETVKRVKEWLKDSRCPTCGAVVGENTT